MNSKQLFFTIIIVLSTTLLKAQNHDDHDHEHDHHAHSGFELGLGFGGFYGFHEKEISVGNHLHFMFYKGKFGIGAGAEAIYTEVYHYNVATILAFRPFAACEISISPGVLLKNEETNKHLFSMHFEAIYSWPVAKIGHLGPVLSYSIAGNDSHVMLGVHLGFDL